MCGGSGVCVRVCVRACVERRGRVVIMSEIKQQCIISER